MIHNNGAQRLTLGVSKSFVLHLIVPSRSRFFVDGLKGFKPYNLPDTIAR